MKKKLSLFLLPYITQQMYLNKSVQPIRTNSIQSNEILIDFK